MTHKSKKVLFVIEMSTKSCQKQTCHASIFSFTVPQMEKLNHVIKVPFNDYTKKLKPLNYQGDMYGINFYKFTSYH